ncbi:MAG: type I-F CRISPR-associated protein Csy3 [Desulfomicrobium sp.]
MSSTLRTASVLAFERKLDPSDALLFSGNWDMRDKEQGWQSIVIREKSVRGTISNRLKTKDQDPAKLDAAIENPNLQTVDVATLAADNDTLKVRFSLRVLSGTGYPSACNEPEYRKKIISTVSVYVEEYGFEELGRRYAFNLANGRFLWRNRIGAEQVAVRVQRLENGLPSTTWNLDALALPLRSFDALESEKQSVEELGALIAQGLRGETHVLLQVTAFVRMGNGQEIFPSQELILDRGRGDKKSKTLYSVNDIAGIHSQKIGNAIRSIDTWYPGASELGPIAVEPYGSVTTLGKAYRQPKEKMDFYTLLDNWMLKDKVPALEQQHFVMAVLVRGGVFGDKDKD